MKKIEIYTWSICPFCVRAKKLLSKLDVEFEEFEISRDRNKLDELKAVTGSGSVPQIFVDGKFIGGFDDMKALYKAGKFDDIFK